MRSIAANLEMHWVAADGGYLLAIRKQYGDGTTVELLLSEAEAGYLSQLITTRKDNRAHA